MKILIFVLVLSLCSCATHLTDGSVSPSAANQRKVELDGHPIAVRGYLIHEPEAYALWDSPSAMKNGDASKCVSILYPANLRESIASHNRTMVIIHGVFHRNITSENRIYLGLCNYTGVEVSQIGDEQ